MVRQLMTGRDDHGAVAILVATFCTVMFGLAALIVDLGYARDVRREYQGAADSAALAAAQVLSKDPAADVTPIVHQYAEASAGIQTADWAGCADPTPLPTPIAPCISSDPAAKRVQVRLPSRQIPTFFAGAVSGSHNPRVSASAQATWGLASGINCVLCVLGNATVTGGSVDVTGGDVAVNGNLRVGGTSQVTAAPGEIGVAGTITGSNLTPPGTKIAPFLDPLSPPNAPVSSPPLIPCSPGTYTTITTCPVLLPGVYVIVGANSLASGSVLGAGVLLYFTCGTVASPRACRRGESGGSLDVAGNAVLTLTGFPNPPGRTFAIVYDANNRALLRVRGDARLSVTDDIYAPSARLVVGDHALVDLQSLVVVNRLTVNGSSSAVTNTYTGAPPPTVTQPKPPTLTK